MGVFRVVRLTVYRPPSLVLALEALKGQVAVPASVLARVLGVLAQTRGPSDPRLPWSELVPVRALIGPVLEKRYRHT